MPLPLPLSCYVPARAPSGTILGMSALWCLGPKGARWLLAATLLPLGAVTPAYGVSRAQAVVGSAVARTEAAGSARFFLGTAAAGTVNFARGELQMSYYEPSTPGKVSEEVREIGDMEYSYIPVAPLNIVGWTAHNVSRKLNELQFPLYAVSPHDKAVAVGHATIFGATTTEYEVKAPGRSFHRQHVAPYSIYLWVDSGGRIRRAEQTEVETGIPGHKGPVTFTSSVEFTDFGLPVKVQAPAHYTLVQGRTGST